MTIGIGHIFTPGSTRLEFPFLRRSHFGGPGLVFHRRRGRPGQHLPTDRLYRHDGFCALFLIGFAAISPRGPCQTQRPSATVTGLGPEFLSLFAQLFYLALSCFPSSSDFRAAFAFLRSFPRRFWAGMRILTYFGTWQTPCSPGTSLERLLQASVRMEKPGRP